MEKRLSPLFVLCLMALLGTLIYSNTFDASFHFDDRPNILENPFIKDFSNFSDLARTRYLGYLSFALNYHWGGEDPFGYHLVNLALHILNGFLVFILISLLFKTPLLSKSFEGASHGIALAVSLLFLSHPIQTQAVTYIIQRFASMMTFFYLLSLVGYLKWRLAPRGLERRSFWYLLSILSALFAMKTKENSFTLPFMIGLMEGIFFSKRRWKGVVPFFFMLLVIPVSMKLGGIGLSGVGEGGRGYRDVLEVAWDDYFFTQFPVILTYLRILFLPIGQNIDYDYPILHPFRDIEVLLSFFPLATLLGIALFFLIRRKGPKLQLISFGILWFFLTLSIESSVIPVGDLIFEHRVYLPSVGIFLAVSAGVLGGGEGENRARLRSLAVLLPVLVFSFATYQRNKVWKNDITLWGDAAQKSPNKGRPHTNLGAAYQNSGGLKEAHREYMRALEINPKDVEAIGNLGTLFGMQKEWNKAMEYFKMAIQIQPEHYGSHYNLALTYKNMGLIPEAIQELKTALQIRPDFDLARQELEKLIRYDSTMVPTY